MIVRAVDARVCPIRYLPGVIKEWRTPRHPEFTADGKTAWRLFNAFTEALKGNLAQKSGGRIQLIENKDRFHSVRNKDGSGQPVPTDITRLTGITQAAVDAAGQPLEHAYRAFAEFVGNRPVIFHNAPFDLRFISRAATLVDAAFDNPVHDTLPMARQAWPALLNHKLDTLARHVGHAEPQHRALGDAKAALAVLLAARQRLWAPG